MGARRLIGAAGLGVLLSGIVVNVYLAIVARALSPAEYATFGSFWALALVLGFGAFLPLEQELARRLPLPGDRRALLRAATGAAGVLTVIALVVLGGALPILYRALDDHVSVLLALVALSVVSAGQFLVRGTLDRDRSPGPTRGGDGAGRHGAPRSGRRSVLRGRARTRRPSAGRSSSRSRSHTYRSCPGPGDARSPGARRRRRGAARRRPHAGLVRDAMPLLVGLGVRAAAAQRAPGAGGGPGGERRRDRGRRRVRRRLHPRPCTAVDGRAAAVGRGPHPDPPHRHGRRREVLVLLVKGAAVLGAVAAVGVPLAWWIGPEIVSLIFGADYAIGGLDLAVIVLGVLVHIGLVVVTQVHVARARHGDRRAELDRRPRRGRREFARLPAPSSAQRWGSQRSARACWCAQRPHPGGVAPPSGDEERYAEHRAAPTYDEAYYRSNGQADDRPALRWYTPPGAPLHRRRPVPRLRVRHGTPRSSLVGTGPATGFEISWSSAAARLHDAPGYAITTDPAARRRRRSAHSPPSTSRSTSTMPSPSRPSPPGGASCAPVATPSS